MRQLIWAAVAAGALVSTAAWACAASAEPRPARTAAVSADRYAVDTAYRTPSRGHGYSAEARRRADCLASYPGYDWRTDRIHLRRGGSVPCPP